MRIVEGHYRTREGGEAYVYLIVDYFESSMGFQCIGAVRTITGYWIEASWTINGSWGDPSAHEDYDLVSIISTEDGSRGNGRHDGAAE